MEFSLSEEYETSKSSCHKLSLQPNWIPMI